MIFITFLDVLCLLHNKESNINLADSKACLKNCEIHTYFSTSFVCLVFSCVITNYY